MITTTNPTVKLIEVPDMSDAVKASQEYTAPLLRDSLEMKKLAEVAKDSVIEQIIAWVNEYYKPYFNESGKYIPADHRDNTYFALYPSGCSGCNRIYVNANGITDDGLHYLRSRSSFEISSIASEWKRTKQNIIREAEYDMEEYRKRWENEFKRSKSALDSIKNFEV